MANPDTYTRDEIDAIIQHFAGEVKKMVDNVITMSEPDDVPSADDTSVWMEVVDTDVSGDFSAWYNHNSTLDD